MPSTIRGRMPISILAAWLVFTPLLAGCTVFTSRLPALLSPAFLRGPYLQSVTPDTIWIAWDSSRATTGKVAYGLTTELGQSVGEAQPATHHEVQLIGLQPDTQYYYRVGKGKTYTFRNTSSRSFVVSGGEATPATLFYNKATRKLGVIGLKHIVFFDEIGNTSFDDAEASISVLKDYMQTGQFTRITAAEYHQMAGRAGRPQFDDRGLAITLAPEQVVSDLKKELKGAAKRPAYDEEKVKRGVYNRARSDAQRMGDMIWTPEIHQELVRGEPAELRSKRRSPPRRCSRSACRILPSRNCRVARPRRGWPRRGPRCRRRCSRHTLTVMRGIHVDNLACFVRPGVIALHWTDDASDPQYAVSQDALRRLRASRDARGRELDVIELPMPGPLELSASEAANASFMAGR